MDISTHDKFILMNIFNKLEEADIAKISQRHSENVSYIKKVLSFEFDGEPRLILIDAIGVGLNKQKFKIRARMFITKMVNIRNFLNGANLTKKPSLDVAKNIDTITRQLAMVQDTQTAIARFFLKYEAEIYSLIPGSGSKAHGKLMKEFSEICNTARLLTL